MQKTKQLILIAGPAASGKTFLINKIMHDQCPGLSELLGITDLASWNFTNARDSKSAQEEGFKRLIVHYDLYNQRNGKKIDQLLLTSSQITTLTLCIPPQVLAHRNWKRIFHHCQRWLREKKNRKFLLRKIYSLSKRQIRNKQKSKVIAIYNDWFDLLQKHQTNSYWVDSTSLDNDSTIHLLGEDRTAGLRVVQNLE